jgi:membrane-bound lytic murein transglycosylase A
LRDVVAHRIGLGAQRISGAGHQRVAGPAHRFVLGPRAGQDRGDQRPDAKGGGAHGNGLIGDERRGFLRDPGRMLVLMPIQRAYALLPESAI